MPQGGAEDGAPGATRAPAALTIMAVYFVAAVGLSNWFPRIPDMQQRLDLSPSTLAICLLGMSIGSLGTTFFAGPLVDRWSPRRTMVVGMVLFAISLCVLGHAWNAPSLFAMMVLLGVGYVTLDVATNVEAARIQESVGRRIMSTCHGIWSVGAFTGAVIGGSVAEAGLPIWQHLTLTAAVILPAGLIVVGLLPPTAPRPSESARGPRVAVPTVAMLGLCLYAFGTILAEITTRNWGAVFLREVVGASAAATGWGLGLFSVMMAAGRLSGDRLSEAFGAATVGRACAIAAVLGMLLLVTSSALPVAFAGCALIGIGVSVGFPLSISAAAALGDRAPALNVAALSLIAYSGSLIGPPLVGFVADGAGLRIGMATLLPLMIVSALFAGALGQGNRKTAEASPSSR